MLAIRSGDVSPRSRDGTSLAYDYHGWLRSKGIDPDSGKMTLAGLAFFDELLAEQNTRNRAKRRRRAA